MNWTHPNIVWDLKYGQTLNSSEERQLMQASQSLLLKVRRNSLSSNDFMAKMSGIHLYCLHNLWEKLCLQLYKLFLKSKNKGWREERYFLYPPHDRCITSNQHSIIQASMTGAGEGRESIQIFIYIIHFCIMFIICIYYVYFMAL